MPQATFLPRAAREHLPKIFMPELQTIERTISGKGEIKIPIDYAKAKNIYLYTQVIRRVQTPSLNLTFNPDKGFYAHVSFCIDDYVLQTYDINFKEQVFLIYDGMLAQQLVSLICAVREIIGQEPLISSHEHNIFLPNRIKFECFSTTALTLTLKGDKLDLCNEDDSKPNPPPNPPPRIPEIPFNTGTEVDNPYFDDPNNENTEPAPGDEFKDDQLPQCIIRNIRVSVLLINGSTFTNDGTWVGNVLINPRVFRGNVDGQYVENLQADGFDQDPAKCPTSSVQPRGLPGYSANAPQAAPGAEVTVEFLN